MINAYHILLFNNSSLHTNINGVLPKGLYLCPNFHYFDNVMLNNTNYEILLCKEKFVPIFNHF